jgi:hypothetical protein
VSASEFAFLALGLLLGAASGAALVIVARARPPAPREVRVTVTPESVPRRSSTLAADPFALELTGPAPFGPGDRRLQERPDEEGGSWPGTMPAGIPVGTPLAASASGSIPVARGITGVRAWAPPMDGERTDVLVDGRASPVAMAGAAARTAAGPVGVAVVAAAPDAAGRIDTEGSRPVAIDGVPPGPVPRAAPTDHSEGPLEAPTGPCAELTLIALDRCTVAERARVAAVAAREALRSAQRDYDEHRARADDAAERADPAQVRAAKERAQLAFRAARDGATTREELDAAAGAWLIEVNRINASARESAADAARGSAAAATLMIAIERLSVEADAARISAESAEEACLAARQAVADCQEAVAAGESQAAAAAAAAPTLEPDRYPEEPPELELEPTGPGEPRILRILRGDSDALHRTAAELAGADLEARARWQLALSGLSDAIVAVAMDAGAVDLPDDDPFWAPFDRMQRREILRALASLGYRYDGLGRFADERVPGQRDLSLAVGYAGLDPMRIRRWPNEREMTQLLRGASVAADEYLAEAAGGLTLGELVGLLGRRADGLTDVWNEWGRVRPRLLAID